ncbi:MAG: zinc ribbon domain-containing protein, partial [Chloroflexi bacterium]
GLQYYRIDVGSVEAGETLGWTFRYDKDDEELTNPASSQPSQLATSPAVPGGTGGGDGDGGSAVVTFVVAFVALLAVGGAGFWLGRSTRPSAGESPAGLSSRRQALNAAFCYKCGAELRPDADFCPRCGAPVRS